jgi:hypothetical protein
MTGEPLNTRYPDSDHLVLTDTHGYTVSILMPENVGRVTDAQQRQVCVVPSALIVAFREQLHTHEDGFMPQLHADRPGSIPRLCNIKPPVARLY